MNTADRPVHWTLLTALGVCVGVSGALVGWAGMDSRSTGLQWVGFAMVTAAMAAVSVAAWRDAG